MNMKRLALTTLVVFVGVFITDFLIHSVWLMETYRATASLWRPELEMGQHMGWLLLAQFLWSLAFVTIWARGFAPTAKTPLCAIMYGLFMGVFFESSTLVLYAVQPFPGSLAAKWFFANVAQAVVMGLVTYSIYRPAPAATTAPDPEAELA